MEILKVNNLRTYFNTTHGLIRAVDGVSFNLRRGETLGIVGESGAGKTVTALSVMGLAARLGAGVTDGEVWYAGKNLLEDPTLYDSVRGRRISLIPQEAGSALNPVLTVGKQVEEMLRVHLSLTSREARSVISRLLESVELPDPGLTARLYPHQLSGGALQRVLLALALCCEPDIIIADEPASSLDVTLQAQVLMLIRNTKARQGLSMVLIAHDLGVISQNSDRVLVMYGGRVLEAGPTPKVLGGPLHPYTMALLEIYRVMDQGMGEVSLTRAYPPKIYGNNRGCVFADRCQKAADLCWAERPEPQPVGEDRVVACHLVETESSHE
ncbi:MAG: ABC transporter ATP-binding protein [Eubacteriales bacterium]